jgi:hypothetical protein
MSNLIDLEKLTPPPWHVRQSESSSKWILADANDEYIATFEIKEAAERCALARNAFDVMMRRGWSPEKYIDGWTATGTDREQIVVLSKWRRELCGWHRDEHGEAQWGPDGNKPAQFPDPFTALVEADKWLRENVEQSA